MRRDHVDTHGDREAVWPNRLPLRDGPKVALLLRRSPRFQIARAGSIVLMIP
jgi:hypothetical protein